MITFGSDVNNGSSEKIVLGSRPDLGSLVVAVHQLPLIPTGGPYILNALNEMIAMFSTSKPGIPKLALLLVQGTPIDITLEDFNKATEAGLY